MFVLVQANVMIVGLEERIKALNELPIRVIAINSGREAARSLKNEKIDSVICKWDLEDMREGTFLRNLRLVKPEILTISFVQTLDRSQEIIARSIGVSVVLTERTTDALFIETVANLLGLSGRKLTEPIALASNKPKSTFVREGTAE